MLADRVQARLDALGISANKASVNAGLGRDYVRDILRGKVKDPGADRLERLAEALHCQTGYLLGSMDEPGNPKFEPMRHPTSVPISYRIRPGFHFDDDGSLPAVADWRVPPLTLHPTSEWLEYVVDAEGSWPVPRGSLLHVTSNIHDVQSLREAGLVVVTRTESEGRLIERSVRRVEIRGFSQVLTTYPQGDDGIPVTLDAVSRRQADGLKVEGRVIAIYQYLDGRLERQMRG